MRKEGILFIDLFHMMRLSKNRRYGVINSIENKKQFYNKNISNITDSFCCDCNYYGICGQLSGSSFLTE